MKVCIVHNEYGKFSGEEAAVAQHAAVLRKNGHEVCIFSRSSTELADAFLGSARGFLAGIYNPFARKAFGRVLAEKKPDTVHIHNVFPLISPCILPECRRQGVPVVMTLHNFRLICPNALLARDGKICHECLGGREWRCLVNNCEDSTFKSLGYALRTAVARKKRYFLDNVDVFVCLTEFQRQLFAKEGFPADRMVVIPNFASVPVLRDGEQTTAKGQHSGYVVCAGRISPEKDIVTLLEAARRLPDIPFKIAGSYWRMPDLPKQASPNVEFLGELQPADMNALYTGARLVVFPTKCYEGFPMVLLEAMAHGKPVVCSRIGGLQEIIEENVNGFSYEPSNTEELSRKIKDLWVNEQVRRDMGERNKAKALGQYGPERHYQFLLSAYEKARMLKSGKNANVTRVSMGNIRVDGLTMRQALDRLGTFVKNGRSHYICFCEGSILSNISNDSSLVTALDRADMVLPDGIAVMMLGRIYGRKFPERIQGPRFMLEVCRESQANGYRHFFYGGEPAVTERLVNNLQKQFPGIRIAGSYSPPFRELTDEEWSEAKELIERSKPDLVWVALGSPRQEKWVAQQVGKIKAPVLLAVGAAFDFHSGNRPWAPAWIQVGGLEWIFRMFTGGRRTFARNFFSVLPKVSWLLLTELFAHRIKQVRSS
jgi:exopolysaccharide biosynthesis WecB/TagA/CpsF family protein